MYPAVTDVKPDKDYTLLLRFENGDLKRFDMKPFLDKGIFKELKDISKFNSVHVAFDTIEWDNNADFDPEALFVYSEKI